MKSLWAEEQIPYKLTGGSCTHWAAHSRYRSSELPAAPRIFFLFLFICLYALPQSLSRIITIAPRARTVCFCLLVQLDIELHMRDVWEKFQFNCSLYCSNLAMTHDGCIKIYLWLQRRSLCLHHLCPSWWISVGSHGSKHLTLSWSLRWHLLDAGLGCSLLSFKI